MTGRSPSHCCNLKLTLGFRLIEPTNPQILGEQNRWFLDMDMLEPSFDHSTFSKNRARLLRHRVSREFFDAVVLQADGCTC